MLDHVSFAARARELASFNGGHAAQWYVSEFSVYFVHGNISDAIAAPLVNVVALRYDILASFFCLLWTRQYALKRPVSSLYCCPRSRVRTSSTFVHTRVSFSEFPCLSGHGRILMIR